jgi:hypothetical protein
MSVAHHEIMESKYGGFPRENWVNGFLEAERLLECAWADRYSLLNELAWEQYPYNGTTIAWPYAATIQGEGVLDSTTPIASYRYAWCRIKYTNKIVYNETAQRFVSEELHPLSMHLPLDYAGFRWGAKTGASSIPVQPCEAPSFIVRSSQYTITYYRVLSVPAYADDYANCTNNGAVASYTLGRSYAAGRLLFGGTTARADTALGSTLKLQVSYRFLIHPSNWNKFWRASTASWETLYHAGIDGTGEYTPHTAVNFASLVPALA